MIHIELSFERPWFLLLLIPALAVIFVPYLRLPSNRRKTWKKILPVILHTVLVILLVLIISGLTFVRNVDEQAVMLLIDVSDSTEPVRETLLARAQEIALLIDRKTPVGVIAFGENTVYTVKLGSDDRTIELTDTESGATDIEAALEYAAMMLPSDRAKRIILLSDGIETAGRAEDAAYYLATRGVRIDSMYFNASAYLPAEVQISSLTIPESAYIGDEIAVHAVIGSSHAVTAGLMLYDNDSVAAAQEVTLLPGSNVFELTAVPETAGAHAYRLELRTLDGDDTLAVNNQSYAYLHASGGTSVLIIADTIPHAETLEAVLESDNTVTTVTARNAPRTIAELCGYDEIILMNVNSADLPVGYDKLLDAYVSVYGRSLLAAGGTDTFMYGGMTGTGFEEMLPVTFELSAESSRQSTALMLVLDCSGSMSQNTQYLNVAKQGAIQTVQAMNSSDFVGVVSFNRTATLQSGLIDANEVNKASLVRTISALSTSRGTYYTEALEMAHAELLNSDAEIRHVIFLSDGNPSDYGYGDAVDAMIEDGITVSTIGLGYSSWILSDLAESGGGRYYYVENAADLPDIMLSETEQITVSSLITGEFVPVTAKKSALTDGIPDALPLPLLYGYLGTTVREDADAYLVTEEGHPLYAVRTYGEGKTACFLSDLAGSWSADWFADDHARQVIARMVSTTVSDTPHTSSILTETAVHGREAEITVRTSASVYDTGEGGTLALTVTVAEESRSHPLTKNADGSYTAVVPAEESGIYEMMIVETDASGRMTDYLQTAFAVSYSGEYDAFAEGGREFLLSLCSPSDGILSQNPEELASAPAEPIGIVYDPLIPLAVTASVLLLADIAIRKLRWKDVVNALIRIGLIRP